MKIKLPSQFEFISKVRGAALPPNKKHKDKRNDYKRKGKFGNRWED